MNRKELEPEESPQARFGAKLREARDAQGLTQDQVGTKGGCSGTHISAVETGRRPPTLRFARKMDRALGTGTKFQQMSKGVRYATLIEGLPGFLEREAKAAEIRLYEVGVIPGLLQIREYALELAESAVRRKTITPEQAEERIRLVEQRQASLERTPPPLISAVLDESCLRRPVGSPAVMRKQYDRLLEFAALPNTVLQVAPFGMGADRPFDLPVTLLTMPDRSLASYAESAHRGHLERDSDFIVPLLTDYHQLQANALSQSESVALIKELRKGTT